MASKFDCDLFVTGCGISGAAASIFAREKGLSVFQAGSTAEIVFASGLFDVYGSKKPYDSIRALKTTNPLHPYARIGAENVRLAMDSFLEWLGKNGMPFVHKGDMSSRLITPMGGSKLTWAVPESFAFGVEALEKKLPTLLVDFHGLREYSAKQIMEVAKRNWPGLSTLKVVFPSAIEQPLLPGSMAQALELPEHIDALAASIKPYIGSAACVGIPAVLGIHNAHLRTQRLSELLGVPVFEIPTLPASVPGFRLKNLFDEFLDKEGIETRRLVRVAKVEKKEDGYLVSLGQAGQKDNYEEIFTKNLLLATGRFIGNGLHADREEGVKETVMNLPVHQPESRDLWHNEDLFHKDGHPINFSGVMVNDYFNPVDHSGNVISSNLYATGTLLAHHDWMREKCGAGIAIASAFVAVQHIARNQ